VSQFENLEVDKRTCLHSGALVVGGSTNRSAKSAAAVMTMAPKRKNGFAAPIAGLRNGGHTPPVWGILGGLSG